MPAISLPQFRAMQAAAKGIGTLGIPQNVGQEFTESPAVPAAEGLTDNEKMAHHERMFKKAKHPASRALHRKLMLHHRGKLKGQIVLDTRP